ncbi:amidohydrolase family protein [Candidatus Nitronereus thalassa]|uniref:Amidohydrolase family protein n=1 Tax=Candidatus Nitronereus thalassa TaxID=3020898 RepID=A0ABU3K7V1_9BACT|nr:amidohydrolase family protein [Candidatus Nitronereus thalassa]MDT7042437.1 amidohydrolase family protein [Candidatus Nitronereus thalassa]
MIIFSNIQKLYDGTSASTQAIHEGVDLWMDEGKVHALKPHDSQGPNGSDIRRVDCSSYIVTPGLIDCHSHVTVVGIRHEDMDTMNTQAGLLYTEKILFTTLVNGGVTTVRDVGGATHFVKRMVDEGMIIGPRMKIAICMLSTTGGHADFRGTDRCHAAVSRLWPPGPGQPSNIVDGPWDCRKRVREIAACGGDLVKICTSPGVISPSDHLEHRDFTQAEVEAICDEAAGRGLMVAAHAHSKSGIRLAIDCGVQDIQHISFMDQDLAERAFAKGCTVTPTSWISRSLSGAEGMSPFVMEKVQQVAAVHAEAVRIAHVSGLKMLTGTDPILPNMHGRNYMEIVSLMEDGLSSLSAWYAGTGLAAERIGQEDTGSIVPGKRADLLFCCHDVINKPALFDQNALVEVVKDGVGYRGAISEIPQRTFGTTVCDSLVPS